MIQQQSPKMQNANSSKLNGPNNNLKAIPLINNFQFLYFFHLRYKKYMFSRKKGSNGIDNASNEYTRMRPKNIMQDKVNNF